MCNIQGKLMYLCLIIFLVLDCRWTYLFMIFGKRTGFQYYYFFLHVWDRNELLALLGLEIQVKDFEYDKSKQKDKDSDLSLTSKFSISETMRLIIMGLDNYSA